MGVPKSRMNFLISNWRKKEHSENTIEAASMRWLIITGFLWGFTFSERMKLWAMKSYFEGFQWNQYNCLGKDFNNKGRKDKEEEKKIQQFSIPPAKIFLQKSSLSIDETLGLNYKLKSCWNLHKTKLHWIIHQKQ